MTLSKAEACAILHISDSTFTRRLKAGRYKGTRTGEGQFSPLTFTYEGIGLPEPTPEPTQMPSEVEAQPIPVVEAKPEPIPDISTPDAFNPNEYRDSFGHRIAGNERHVLFASQPPRSKFDTDAHMPEGIRRLQSSGVGENPVDTDAYRDLITKGSTVAERMAAMGRSDRSLTDQQKRHYVDRAAFRTGLAQGFSR